MRLNPRRSHDGYIFLITVLAVGSIAVTVSISLLLRGWAAEQNGRVVRELSQALEYASSCVERSIRNLRSDVTYSGNETLIYPTGSCTLRVIGGNGGTDRRICVEGRSGNSVRRFEVILDRVIPTVIVHQWNEVTSFTLCP